jgi:hypothetical protein
MSGWANRPEAPLRLALDPALLADHQPEIAWTWRLLLTGAGWRWRVVAVDEPCDVAYLRDPAAGPAARLVIQAEPRAWADPSSRRLESVSRQERLSYPRYAGQTVEPPLQPDAQGRLVCRRDLLFDLFWLATGQEERHWPRDRHGFFDLTGTAAGREQLPRLGLASEIETWLRAVLLERGAPPPLPRWPAGKRAAASLSHDVDYPEVVRWLEPARVLQRRGPAGWRPALDVLIGRRNHWCFDDWLALERRLETRSAFYFVPRRGSLVQYALGRPDPFYDLAAPRFRRLFTRLEAAGCEVGLHASYGSYRSREHLAADLARLAEAHGRPIRGNRHHYWHLDPADPQATLLLHEQVGLEYDCSLTHERYVGWRYGLSRPYFPFHAGQRRALTTLQLPTGWEDAQLFRHRRLNPGEPVQTLLELAERTAKQHGLLLVDVHDYVFDDDLFPGWRAALVALWEHLLARGDFWIAPPGEVAAHWRRREAELTAASQGLGAGQ